MIPIDVENRIAKYFYHRYLSDEIRIKVEAKLLSECIWTEEQDLNQNKLVPIGIIDS